MVRQARTDRVLLTPDTAPPDEAVTDPQIDFVHGSDESALPTDPSRNEPGDPGIRMLFALDAVGYRGHTILAQAEAEARIRALVDGVLTGMNVDRAEIHLASAGDAIRWPCRPILDYRANW